jgi:hypothetical protein
MEAQEISASNERIQVKENASHLIDTFQTTFQQLADTKSEYKKMKQEKRSGFNFRRGSADYQVKFGQDAEKDVYMSLQKIANYGEHGEERFKTIVELNVAQDKNSNDKSFPAIKYSVIRLGDTDDMHLEVLSSYSDFQAIEFVEETLGRLKSSR